MWPRGANDHAVLAGVIDAGYRGEIKVKLYNPTDKRITIYNGDYIAQLVPVSTLDMELRGVRVGSISKNTDRGESGGINR